MYSGTMIDDLIASVARAERAARGEHELEARELPPTMEEVSALCAHFLTDAQVMAGAA
jgi:hypothetical protein